MAYNGYPSRQYTTFTEPSSRSFLDGNVNSTDQYPSSDYRMNKAGLRGADPGNLLLREMATSIIRLPLDLRLARLQQILTSHETRELQEIFPACVEAVFGFENSEVTSTKLANSVGAPQWNGANQPYIPVSFCDITHDYQLLFEAAYNFLQPEGPLFQFILSVSHVRNPQLAPRFAFPVACLSFSVKQNLENGFVAPWYRDKIDVDYSDTEGLPEFISLNAFDFYFAHFAYHLVNPDIRTNVPAQPDCLYMTLIDVYSECFFNPKAIVDNQNLTSSHGFMHKRPQSLLTNLSRRSGLENSFGREPENVRQKYSPLATSECLESLINIFVEFWLNTSGFTSSKSSRKYPRKSLVSDRSRHSPSFGQSPLSFPGGKKRTQSLASAPTVFPPTSALQAFRQVVKALHEFVFAQSSEQRGLRKNLESSLLEMKRHIIPQLIQRPLYDLLKDSIRKYPMDASFRFVYELWLTYLQPWRYEIALDVSKSDEIIVVSQDPRWMNFMTDNLLFYSTLFQAFLDRMLRVDFSVPFNTLAIFRVTKVFSETGIFGRIISIEAAASGSGKSHGTQGAQLSPAKSAIRNHFADLEGQSFSYVSIRSPDNVAKVLALLKILHREHARCHRKVNQPNTAAAHHGLSVEYFKDLGINTLKWIFGLVSGPIVGMQLQPVELEKMSRHLSKSIECLSSMYEVDAEDYSRDESISGFKEQGSFLLDRDQSLMISPIPSQHSRPSRRHSVPAYVEEEKLPFLTEPERRAPRSWEIKPLILVLNEISTKINETYGDKIIELYNGQDFLSRLIHPLIEPPHNPSVPLTDEQRRLSLPARINLRPIASKYKIYGLLFIIFFMWFAGFGFFRGLFCLLMVPAFFLIVNAIFGTLTTSSNQR